VEAAPLAELVDVIRPGGLANQKAPRIQAALRALVANGGGYSLEFLAQKPALEARDWLAAIPGIGKKTASVVLLFSFGLPLMPVDRHVHRVSQRIGLIPPKVEADAAHDYYLAMLEPEQMFETHVSLISHGRRTCHAQRPDCEHCPLAPRCRYFVPDAP
jgi:endonuclease-3